MIAAPPPLLHGKYLGLAAVFLVFHAYVPFAAWRARARLAGRAWLPPRARYLSNAIGTQVFFLAVAFGVAYALRIPLYPRALPRATDLLLGLAVLAALVAFMRPRWRRAVRKGDRRLYFFMPTGGREQGLWAALSLAAGFGEETTYRGVIYWILFALTGRWWLAGLLGALVFAGAHAFQSRTSMMLIFVFALLFQALAIATGALYVSMAVHALYDVIAGFTYSRLGRELGYRVDGAPAAAAGPAPAA